MKDLGKRFCTGLIGIMLLIFIILKGGYLFYASIYILSIIGLREFYKAIEKINITPVYYIGYIGTTGLFISYLINKNYINISLALITLVSLILLIINKEISLHDISITIIGILYIPFILFHLIYLNQSNYIWLIFIIAFGTDTFAYTFGNIFGKHKLCPKISPNKTIEGALGGIIGCAILVVVYSIYFNLRPLWQMIIISVICSIMAQLGDLVASKIKRITGIKDYGFIMPGHGGVLDRFDSIIFTIPLIYYYISSFLIN